MTSVYISSGSGAAAALLLAALLVPLAGGAATWGISLYGKTLPGNGWRNARDGILWGAQGLTLLCLLGLIPLRGPRFSLPDLCGVGVSFRVAGLPLALAGTAAALWLAAGLFGREALAHAPHKMRYFFFLSAAESAALGAFLAADFFTLLLFSGALGTAFWVLTGHTETPAAHRAAVRFLAHAAGGTFSAAAGALLLAQQFGTLRFAQLQVIVPLALTDTAGTVQLYAAGALLMLGFSAMAGVFPFCSWLPGACGQAPSPAAALLAGVQRTAGLFGCVSVCTALFRQERYFGAALLVWGLAALAACAFAALRSSDFARASAYAAAAESGWVFAASGLACLGRAEGAAALGVLLVGGSFAAAALLFCAGCAGMLVHRTDLAGLRGFCRGRRILAAALLAGAAGFAGLPLTAGYVGRALVYAAAGAGGGLLRAAGFALPVPAGILTAAMVRLCLCLLRKAPPAEPEEAPRAARTLRHVHLAAAALLGSAAAVLVPGLLPGWAGGLLAQAGCGYFGMALAAGLPLFSASAAGGCALSLAVGAALAVPALRRGGPAPGGDPSASR